MWERVEPLVNKISTQLSAKEITTAADMSTEFKTIGEQIMKDYVMDGKEYEENEVTGSLSKDQLERYLNISQYVGRVADQMEVPFTRDWQEKGGCLLGVKFSCQVGMFRNFFWKNIEDQLSSVKAAKGQDNKAVISFNCYYKVDHLNEMLKKLTEDEAFDVVCMQELCGPWLVTNGMDNKSHVKNVNGNFIACKDDDAARILPQDTKGRMLKKDELQNMVNIIDQKGDQEGDQEAKTAANDENKEVGGPPPNNDLIRPSKIRIDAHNKKKEPDPLNWYRTQEELIKYIKEQKEKLKGKTPVTDISSRGFDSVKWARWWLGSFEDGYTIIHDENSCYVTAEFKEDVLPGGYSIIFAPANHTNGFFLCSFGNAIIFKTQPIPAAGMVQKILYSDPPSSPEGPMEGRNALKVKIDGINYICMHLDEKATWKSQITMLKSWKDKDPQFFEGPCIVCGDMNVMDISILPIRDLLEEPKFNDYEVGPVMPLNREVPLAPVDLGDTTNKARCTTLWQLFKDMDLNSIYDYAAQKGRHMITVANAGGVDYVGYSPHFTLKKAGVIFPVLPEDLHKGNSTGGIQELVGQHNYISDHLLPFLVFKKVDPVQEWCDELPARAQPRTQPRTQPRRRRLPGAELEAQRLAKLEDGWSPTW